MRQIFWYYSTTEWISRWSVVNMHSLPKYWQEEIFWAQLCDGTIKFWFNYLFLLTALLSVRALNLKNHTKKFPRFVLQYNIYYKSTKSRNPSWNVQKNFTKKRAEFSRYLTGTPNDETFKNYFTNPPEMKSLIRKISNIKIPGVDDIDNKLIKNLSKKETFNYHTL